jgi:hypothetical protein
METGNLRVLGEVLGLGITLSELHAPWTSSNHLTAGILLRQISLQGEDWL